MKKIVFSILFFLFLVELLLRFVGIFKSYDEKVSGHYASQYRQSKPSWFHTWQPNSTAKYSQVEFEYYNKYNDLGHRELVFSSFLKDTLTEKIICLGDSFTEGDGAPADSTWVKRLDFRLNQKIGFKKYRLYNAGVCGSDVYFNNRMLVYKLMALKPKMVIECVNFSDIHDIIYRGGGERFNKDGTTSGKVGPTWEYLFKYSHVFRALITILGYNGVLIKSTDFEKEKKNALNLIKEQIEITAKFCQTNKVKYILLVHPFPSDMNFKNNKNEISTILISSPFVVNLFDPMVRFYEKKDISEYSWKINGHFNSRGYEIMGDLIFDGLSQKMDAHQIWN